MFPSSYPPYLSKKLFLYAEKQPGVIWIALTAAKAFLKNNPERYSICCILCHNPLGFAITIAGVTDAISLSLKYLTIFFTLTESAIVSASELNIISPLAFLIPKFKALPLPAFFLEKTLTPCFSNLLEISKVLSLLPSSTTR